MLILSCSSACWFRYWNHNLYESIRDIKYRVSSQRQCMCKLHDQNYDWAASSEFGTYRLCEQRRFRRACASAQSRQNLRCSLIQAVSQAEPSDRKPDLWPLWMAGHAQLKFVMTECSKTKIRLTRHMYKWLLSYGCWVIMPESGFIR